MTLSGLQGWVNDISFAPNSNTMIVLLHNNQMLTKVLQESGNKNEPDSIIPWKGLPHFSGVFTNEETFVTGSFENKLNLFKRKGS